MIVLVRRWSTSSLSAFSRFFFFFFFFFFLPRVQRDGVPTIQCVVKLLWSGGDLHWWQCHSVVRSRKRLVSQPEAIFDISLQELANQPIDWVDSRDDRTIDSAHLFVRCRIDLSASSLTVFARALNDNMLTGELPSTIGQLSALTFLCVFEFSC
jgi:hypothetical protein